MNLETLALAACFLLFCTQGFILRHLPLCFVCFVGWIPQFSFYVVSLSLKWVTTGFCSTPKSSVALTSRGSNAAPHLGICNRLTMLSKCLRPMEGKLSASVKRMESTSWGRCAIVSSTVNLFRIADCLVKGLFFRKSDSSGQRGIVSMLMRQLLSQKTCTNAIIHEATATRLS